MASGNRTVDRLYYGDNLDILRAHIPDESVDLVYLDPPFNSNASYNILFRSPTGIGADASIEAFDDSWSWGPAAAGALMDITNSGNHRLHVLMQAMRTAIGENAMMAYLVMMAVRLQELHRVLKPSGSLYLHCDPTASHYLKLVLDAVFGVENFRNELIWQRTAAKGDARNKFGAVHDCILFYAKSVEALLHPIYAAKDAAYIARFRLNDDDGRGPYRLAPLDSPNLRPNLTYCYKGFAPPAKGWRVSHAVMEQLDKENRLAFPRTATGRIARKHYLSEQEGRKLADVWTDLPPLQAASAERLGYPTQKPRTLLERIIATSSNPGDVVLDPFCGCGTAVDAAQKLGRHWIGIDITHLAIGLIEKRLREGYGEAARFETIGSPRDLASAQRLAVDDPHQFQHWITLKLGGWPWMGGRKGGDKGVDGYFYYVGEGGQTQTGVISVKAGHNVNPAMVRDLGRVMQRDGHRIGLFVCAAAPTRGMEQEADSHGLVQTEFGRFPALQIFTLAELFADRHPRLPPLVSPNRKAPRIETRVSHQPGAQAGLDFGGL
ncbi:DNA methyltransferase [Sphingobium yanoikuyae]|jgi:site-specific DNA-methyltransferase (adenine-specific)|uniref:DNA methyltransferase n=2 Tax=Sphingobium yanoikuyae TaxID=13690 RepID=UPI003B908B4A